MGFRLLLKRTVCPETRQNVSPCWLTWCSITADTQSSRSSCSSTKLRSGGFHSNLWSRNCHLLPRFHLRIFLSQLTLAGGERRREVFIHSLELGHTAGTRALKSMGQLSVALFKTATVASKRAQNAHVLTHTQLMWILSEGAAGKRFGIDEEREAVPLTLSVTYNKVLLLHRDFLHCTQW